MFFFEKIYCEWGITRENWGEFASKMLEQMFNFKTEYTYVCYNPYLSIIIIRWPQI